MNRLLIIALALLLTACHSHDPHEIGRAHV